MEKFKFFRSDTYLKNPKKWILIFIISGFFLLALSGVYALQKGKIDDNTPANASITEEKYVQIYEAYDCDQLRIQNIELINGETPLITAMKYLPGPVDKSTIANYAKSAEVIGTIAYIDWPIEMASLANIDTSCASQEFLLPIDKTLTNISPIRKVIHSMDGSVNAFYQRMGLSCPQETPECNYDVAKVKTVDDFYITNIGDSARLGDHVSSLFPIFAYQCDIYEVKNNIPLRYSKIDFFISGNEKSSPTIFLGTTPGGSAGSGECDLQENENGLNAKLVAGKYRIWAVRYIDNKPDAQTPPVYFTIENSVTPRQ